MGIAALRRLVWCSYRKAGRSYSWRQTFDPYAILVSDVMVQQTQTHRVEKYYQDFLRCFSSVYQLAEATLAEVPTVWSGLGYNRRARALRDAAVVITDRFGGKVPDRLEDLQQLPGVGAYTGAAVQVFAFGAHDVLLET